MLLKQSIPKPELLIIPLNPLLPVFTSSGSGNSFSCPGQKTFQPLPLFLSNLKSVLSAKSITFTFIYREFGILSPLACHQVTTLLKLSYISFWPHPYYSPCSLWSSNMDLLAGSLKLDAHPTSTLGHPIAGALLGICDCLILLLLSLLCLYSKINFSARPPPSIKNFNNFTLNMSYSFSALFSSYYYLPLIHFILLLFLMFAFCLLQ